MSFLDKFHHQITGNPNGHKLVFLHGLMGSGHNWRRIITPFEDEFHILTFDQRGHGRSFQPESGFHPRDYAMDLKGILDELGWESVALVGHSMGGRNALEFAVHFARRVNVLVIEDIGPESSSAAIANIERLLNLVPTPFASRAEAKDFFDNKYADLIRFNPKPEVIAKFFYTNLTDQPDGTQNWRFSKKAILESLRAGRNEDRWDQVANLTMPVLVVRGERSQDLPPAVYARMLKTIPHVTGREIADSGHWVHFDQPEAFISVLKEFFHVHLGTNL